jgi:hypothetical protein
MNSSPHLIEWFYFFAMGFVGLSTTGIGFAVKLREWEFMSKSTNGMPGLMR